MNDSVYNQHVFLKLLLSPKWRLVRHLLLVAVMMVSTYPGIDPSIFKTVKLDHPEKLVAAINKGALIVFFVSMTFIYINIFLLIPKLLFRNRFLYYFLACFAIGIAYYLAEVTLSAYLLRDYPDLLPSKGLSVKGFIDSTLVPLIFLAATAGYKVFKKWIVDNAQLTALKDARMKEELVNLRNQINPHFLFNTLNNLHTLIETDKAKASAVVLGLSDVLRYHLYETNSEKVLLKKDIEIVRLLLELEKLRRDDFQFSLNMEGDLSGLMIPPFTFINFIDNAIKHSADNRKFSYIAIDFKVVENRLTFTCKNSMPAVSIVRKEGGIGLLNIRRRLELMYGKDFTLNAGNNGNTYLVTLMLPL